MKRIITCLAVVLCSTSAFSQYYFNTYNPAGMNPGGLNTDAEQPFGATGVTAADGYTSIIANGTSTLTWSPVQTIPFPFNFDGSPVTQYKVSNSGVLTFTTTATTIPSNTNATIPDASIPDKSIMIWGLEQGAGGSTNDGVITKTHGTTPNRQHWINFASYGAPGASGTQWTYWGIVLEETTNNIYIADLRTYTTPLTLTLGIQIDPATAFSIAGAPNTPSFVTNGGNASDPTDNVYYEFIQGTQPANDIFMVSLDLKNTESNSSPISITGELRNNGTAALTSFDLSWTADGGATNNTANITANVASGDAYTFTHPTSWTPMEGATYTVDVTASNPNGVVDGNLTNNSASATSFINTGVSAYKRVLLEEFTTAPCQFCPDGSRVVEEIKAADERAVAVGHHACFGTDAMTIAEAVAYCNAFSSGAPTATVDRRLFDGEAAVGHSRGTWGANVTISRNLGAPVLVDLTGTYDSTNRNVSVDVLANFVDVVPSGDIRVTLFVIEDNVTGIGSGYNQVNAYNNSFGHPYAGAGNPIVGFNHRHVSRQVLPSTWGDNTIIPSTPVRGTEYTKNFSFTLNNSWDKDEISLVAFVHYYNASGGVGNEIMNTIEVKLDDSFTAIGETKTSVSGLKIYPNPTADRTSIRFNLSNSKAVSMVVRDITGKEVISQAFGMMTAGQQTITMDASNLSNGIYFATVQIGEEIVTKKITVNK